MLVGTRKSVQFDLTRPESLRKVGPSVILWCFVGLFGGLVGLMTKTPAASPGHWPMFQGCSSLKLDAKGRMTIPTAVRARLDEACGGQFTITLHPQGSLLLIPQNIWDAEVAKLADAQTAGEKALRRIFLGFAETPEVDSAGRVLLSSELREEAGIDRDVKLLGVGKHLEIWAPAALRAKTLELRNGDLANTALSLF